MKSSLKVHSWTKLLSFFSSFQLHLTVFLSGWRLLWCESFSSWSYILRPHDDSWATSVTVRCSWQKKKKLVSGPWPFFCQSLCRSFTLKASLERAGITPFELLESLNVKHCTGSVQFHWQRKRKVEVIVLDKNNVPVKKRNRVVSSLWHMEDHKCTMQISSLIQQC